ncbi:MAG: hypothetical protein AAB368_09145, partial [bacterium]
MKTGRGGTMSPRARRAAWLAVLAGLACARAASAGIVSTAAGNGTGAYTGDGGSATAASLFAPFGAATDATGNVYVADASNHAVRRVDADTGLITTVAGGGGPGYSGDAGPATTATLNQPQAVAVDAAGNLFIADTGNNVIRRVDAGTGDITTVAGDGTAGGGDGSPGTTGQLFSPTSISFDGLGNLFIADAGNALLRKYDTAGDSLTTVAGSPYGVPFSFYGIAADPAGNVYAADPYACVVWLVDTGGGVNYFAGVDFGYFYSGDGGPAAAATMFYPNGVALDNAGNVFIADSANSAIRRVDAGTGIITTVAGLNPGTFTFGYSGDGGP